MANNFFSNPEDELTVEEIKSLGKLIPKLPNLSGVLNPKNWDSRFAPGRGEGRAAFAQSKRNLDAMLERDALTVKNRGNTGTFINNPQTKKPFATPWKESEAERKSKLLEEPPPNTDETVTKSNPQEVSASKVAKIPEESNYIKSGRTQAEGKGSVAKNQAVIADIRASAPSVLTGDQKNPIVDTKTINKELGKMDLNLKGLDEASATRIGNMQSFMNNASPRMKDLMIKNPAMAEDLLRDAGKGIGVKGAGASSLAGNLGTASAGLKIASAMMDKKQKPSTAGMEGKGGSIDQVAVAAGINPEEFYAMV